MEKPTNVGIGAFPVLRLAHNLNPWLNVGITFPGRCPSRFQLRALVLTHDSSARESESRTVFQNSPYHDIFSLLSSFVLHSTFTTTYHLPCLLLQIHAPLATFS